jgi:hypothetical protein
MDVVDLIEVEGRSQKGWFIRRDWIRRIGDTHLGVLGM